MSDTQFMHKLINFIYNKNIDVVEQIYNGKVADYMLEHLIDKKNGYKEENNNLSAWANFIGNLDEENSNILVESIKSEGH